MKSVLKDLLDLFCSLVPEGHLPGGSIDCFEYLDICFPEIYSLPGPYVSGL